MPAIEIREVWRSDDRGGNDAVVEFSVHHPDGTRDLLQIKVRSAPEQLDDLKAMAWDLLSARLDRYGHLAPAPYPKAAVVTAVTGADCRGSIQ